MKHGLIVGSATCTYASKSTVIRRWPAHGQRRCRKASSRSHKQKLCSDQCRVLQDAYDECV